MKLELGTYVDCSELTDEQRQKLLDKFVELVGDNCSSCDIDSVSNYSSDQCCTNLVYTRWGSSHNIWFHNSSYCKYEKSYYDFFPEELEAPVKRVKTIDLERRTKEELVDAIYLGQEMDLENLRNNLNSICSKNFGEACKVIVEDSILNIYKTVFAESEEDYQQRIQREKDLNDMYNANVQNLTKKILHLQQGLDDVSAILNGQTTLGASQVMDIKKIIGGK